MKGANLIGLCYEKVFADFGPLINRISNQEDPGHTKESNQQKNLFLDYFLKRKIFNMTVNIVLCVRICRLFVDKNADLDLDLIFFMKMVYHCYEESR